MSLSKSQVEKASTLQLEADKIKAALTGFFTAAKDLAKGTKDDDNRALVHQVIVQVLGTAAMSKTVKSIEAELDFLLENLDWDKQALITTPSQAIGAFLVPSYTYTPTEKVSAKILDANEPKSVAFVLRAIADNYPEAIEKRLVASVFKDPVKGPTLLEACGGLVGFETKQSWSVTKTK